MRQPSYHLLPPSPHLSCITLPDLPRAWIACRVPGQPALGEAQSKWWRCWKGQGWAAGREICWGVLVVPLKEEEVHCASQKHRRERTKRGLQQPFCISHVTMERGSRTKQREGQGAQSRHWVMRVFSVKPPQVMGHVSELSCTTSSPRVVLPQASDSELRASDQCGQSCGSCEARPHVVTHTQVPFLVCADREISY